MHTITLAYGLLLVATGVGSVSVTWSIRRRYNGIARRSVLMLLLCCALWAITYGLELLSPDLPLKTFWVYLQFISIVSIPGAWLSFAIYFTMGPGWFTNLRQAAVHALPSVMLALVITNHFHNLVWYDFHIETSGPVSFPVILYGAAMQLFLAYSFALVAAGAFLIVRHIQRRGPTYRLQGYALILGIILPAVVAFFEQTRLFSFYHLELAPPAAAIFMTLLFSQLDSLRWWDILAISGPAVVRSMQDGVIVLDPQMRLVSMNPAAERIIGCDEASMVHKPLDRFFAGWPILAPDGTRPRAHEIHTEVTRDGMVYDLTLSSILDTRGLPISRVVVLHDITRRKQAEAELRKSEERLRLFFENVDEMIYLIDENLKVVSITPSVERLIGYQPADLLGHTVPQAVILPPEYIEKALQESRRVLAGEHIASSIYEFNHKDGRRRWMEVSGAPMTINSEAPLIICVARDVSERIHAQEQLQASLREKEALLKEVHHRVKNNLQVISSLLNLQSAHISDPATRALFLESQNRVRSMALVHQKLYAAADLARISFAEYLQSLVDALNRSYYSPIQKIQVSLSVDEFTLDIDQAIPCGLIINELVTNSFKHAFPDGRNGCINVEARQAPQGDVTIAVGDDGVGYPPGLDFFTLPSLGLNLVNGLAAQIGARLQVFPGPGTHIQISFPTS